MRFNDHARIVNLNTLHKTAVSTFIISQPEFDANLFQILFKSKLDTGTDSIKNNKILQQEVLKDTTKNILPSGVTKQPTSSTKIFAVCELRVI